VVRVSVISIWLMIILKILWSSFDAVCIHSYSPCCRAYEKPPFHLVLSLATKANNRFVIERLVLRWCLWTRMIKQLSSQ
jgi:hypothetical protein